jgi:DNA polymerase elongation subunit (family B)
MLDIAIAKGDKDNEKKYFLRQWGVKVIMNSFYGLLLFSNSRISNEEAGSVVTFMGREINKLIEEECKKLNMLSLYGDTDSIFVAVQETITEQIVAKGREVQSHINRKLIEFSKSLNLNEDTIFKIEFEKVFRTLLFLGVKKKYAGWVIWEKGVYCDKLKIVGFESMRSDTPSVVRQMQKTLLDMLLKGKEKIEVEQFLFDFKRKLQKTDIREISFPIGVTKSIEEMEADDSIVSQIARASGGKVFENLKLMFGEGKSPEEVAQFIHDYKKYNPEEIEINKYHNFPIHIRALYCARKLHNFPSHEIKIKYAFIKPNRNIMLIHNELIAKGLIKKMPKHSVMAITDDNFRHIEEYQIDWEQMFERAIYLKVEDILLAVDMKDIALKLRSHVNQSRLSFWQGEIIEKI